MSSCRATNAKIADIVEAAHWCEVCGKPVRAGLRFCSGLSECFMKGANVGANDDEGFRCECCNSDSDEDHTDDCTSDRRTCCDSYDDEPHGKDCGPTPLKDVRVEDGNLVATDVASGATVKLTTSDDPVNSPAHYMQGPVELIEVFEEMGIAEDFCHGNMIKYLERAGVKDPAKELEDFRKARWYAKRLVKIVGERVLAKRGA